MLDKIKFPKNERAYRKILKDLFTSNFVNLNTQQVIQL